MYRSPQRKDTKIDTVAHPCKGMREGGREEVHAYLGLLPTLATEQGCQKGEQRTDALNGCHVLPFRI